LNETFAPELRKGFSDMLGKDAELSVDSEQNVFFHYPKSFSNSAILQAIRLEIGPLAAWIPSENRVIKPYAAEQYPAVFSSPEASIRTVMAKRTFWEKATILHQEAHRDETRSLPLRYSRHYYDVYRMAKSPVKDEEALPGSFMLMPPTLHVRELEKDYQGMQSMLFGEKPAFNEIMDGIKILEKEVNALQS
jgi:hypothetical protein